MLSINRMLVAMKAIIAKHHRLIWGISIMLVFLITIVLIASFFKQHYYRDRLVLVGQEQGEDFALVLELTRHELLPFLYTHSYTIDYLDANKTYSQIALLQTLSSTVKNKKFLSNFSNTNNYNTSEETYAATIQFADEHFAVDLTDLRGDFIVNNSAERLTYVNMGQTVITHNGNKINVSYLLSKGSSTDADAVALDNAVTYFGQHTFFSADSGDMYLIDASEVDQNDTNYTSHKWLLHKDARSNLKKYINQEITLQHESDCDQFISWPDQHTLSTGGVNQITHKTETLCLVRGVVDQNGVSSNVIGLAVFQE